MTAPVYLSLTGAARRWGVSRERVRQWAEAERIPGAARVTGDRRDSWIIPVDAVRPEAREGGRPKRGNVGA